MTAPQYEGHEATGRGTPPKGITHMGAAPAKERLQAIAGVAITLVGLAVMCSIAIYQSIWPRLAPGTECIVVGDNGSMGHIEAEGIIVYTHDVGVDIARAQLGTRTVVIKDEGSIWHPARWVWVRFERPGVLAEIERTHLAPLR